MHLYFELGSTGPSNSFSKWRKFVVSGFELCGLHYTSIRCSKTHVARTFVPCAMKWYEKQSSQTKDEQVSRPARWWTCYTPVFVSFSTRVSSVIDCRTVEKKFYMCVNIHAVWVVVMQSLALRRTYKSPYPATWVHLFKKGTKALIWVRHVHHLAGLETWLSFVWLLWFSYRFLLCALYWSIR